MPRFGGSVAGRYSTSNELMEYRLQYRGRGVDGALRDEQLVHTFALS